MSNSEEDIRRMRREYGKSNLVESEIPNDPILLFEAWMEHALAVEKFEVNAFTLATAAPDGQPSARVVLLRGLLDGGFEFYTNYSSHKGTEMSLNNKVCANFFWPVTERQVRIKGAVAKVSSERSDEYFNGRPRAAQIGAWASSQSTSIANREALNLLVEDYTAKYEGQPVPRPEHWGGLLIMPEVIEFWQGRPSRLHDRIQFTNNNDGQWARERLSP